MTDAPAPTGRIYHLRHPVIVEGRTYRRLFLRRGTRRDLRPHGHRELSDEASCTLLMSRLASVPLLAIEALSPEDASAVLDHIEAVLRHPPLTLLENPYK